MTRIPSNDSTYVVRLSINVNSVIESLLKTYTNHGFSSVIISLIHTDATFVTPTIGSKTMNEILREVCIHAKLYTSLWPKRKYRFWYVAVLWSVLFNNAVSCWYCIAPVTDEWVECCWQWKTEALGEKPVPVPIRLPPISRGLTQDSTLTYKVRCWRLTARATAQPQLQCCSAKCKSYVCIEDQITNTVKQRSSWGANSFPASQEFPHVLWKSEVH